jgi:hypothetical protein
MSGEAAMITGGASSIGTVALRLAQAGTRVSFAELNTEAADVDGGLIATGLSFASNAA